METHPPWLRFHLGISRWELYYRKDPNLAQLTHYLATQRILCAGEQKKKKNGGAGLEGERTDRSKDRARGKATRKQRRDFRGGCTVSKVKDY